MHNIWGNNENLLFSPANAVDIQAVEKYASIILPDLYKALMLQHNGGYTKSLSVEYQNEAGIATYGFEMMMPLVSSNDCVGILEYLKDEILPKGLIPFSDDGGGNFLCFDYRKSDQNPSIVLWIHDESIHFIAHNFDDFLKMLQAMKL